MRVSSEYSFILELFDLQTHFAHEDPAYLTDL